MGGPVARERNSGSASRELIDSLVNGRYFESIGILNCAEKDFFHWIAHSTVMGRLEGCWLKLLNQLRTYNFDEIAEDLLKGVYQELIDPMDRHDLGEYYAPDWLCEKVVAHLMDRPGGTIPSVIDLTCGSGSFLRASIHRIRQLIQGMDGNVKWDTVLTAILANVHGIDIHPLAVMISKANYVLAIRELLPHRRKPIQIPVYLADALFMPRTDEIVMHEYKRRNVILSFLDQKYVFPHSLFSDPQSWEHAIVLCSEAAAALANDKDAETRDGFLKSLAKLLPHIAEQSEREAACGEMYRLTENLAVTIRERRDTIWSYILRNNFRPLFLHGAYDVIVGNPPWLSLRYISDPGYQEEIKSLSVTTYALAPKKQKLVTQMGLATLFLVHAVHMYLKKGGVLGYVMPRSIFSAVQHEKFRAESFQADCDITEYWDLDGVTPLFNVPSCAVFAKKGKPKRNGPYKALFVHGKLPERDLPLSKVRPLLQEETGRLFLSHMGERSALSRKEIAYQESLAWYKDKFSQGATIVPRNFFFVAAPEAHELESEEFFARTDPEQAKDGKPPYKDIFLKGTVETRYVFRTALSKNVLPFHAYDLPYVLLPVIKEGGRYALKTAAELKALGDRKIAEWFQQAEKEWNDSRGAKAEKQDLYGRLNYQNELMKQDPEAGYVVLYNTSGMNVSSAFLEMKKCGRPFFADHKCYWSGVQTKNEGNYLVSILNSTVVNLAVKPFQSRGLLGERDIHKKILELPIPQFDKGDKHHQRLAGIGKESADKVESFATSGGLAGTLAKRRGVIRELLSKELGEIDDIVQRILKP